MVAVPIMALVVLLLTPAPRRRGPGRTVLRGWFGLAAAGRVERGHFVGAEQPPAPRSQVTQAQWPHTHAAQLQHRVMYCFHHPPHLALAALVDDHAQPLI